MSCLWKFHVLLAYNLQPLAKEIRSSIKDTNDSVNKINNFKLPKNSFLVTMDVKALCINISSNKSIAAAKEKCDNYTKKSVATKVITTFLALTLTLNNFIFNSKFYLQIKGCAMRIMWPYIRKHIHVLVQRERYIDLLIKNKSSTYLCFIDYIFMAWTQSENQLECFITEINTKHNTIKCYFKFLKIELNVLALLQKP